MGADEVPARCGDSLFVATQSNVNYLKGYVKQLRTAPGTNYIVSHNNWFMFLPLTIFSTRMPNELLSSFPRISQCAGIKMWN